MCVCDSLTRGGSYKLCVPAQPMEIDAEISEIQSFRSPRRRPDVPYNY